MPFIYAGRRQKYILISSPKTSPVHRKITDMRMKSSTIQDNIPVVSNAVDSDLDNGTRSSSCSIQLIFHKKHSVSMMIILCCHVCRCKYNFPPMKKGFIKESAINSSVAFAARKAQIRSLLSRLKTPIFFCGIPKNVVCICSMQAAKSPTNHLLITY